MDLMTRLQKTVTKQGIGVSVLAAATNPITVVACVFNPVLAVAVVAGVAATVKACEAPLEETQFATLELSRTWDVVEEREMTIQYNEYPEAKTQEEIASEVDAELEALKKELGLV